MPQLSLYLDEATLKSWILILFREGARRPARTVIHPTRPFSLHPGITCCRHDK
jgi:hypothetical protein